MVKKHKNIINHKQRQNYNTKNNKTKHLTQKTC